MAIKSAEQLLSELVAAVRPSPGTPIQLTEIKPATNDFPNWAPNVGNLPPDAQVRYDSAVVELRRQSQLVDWSGVKLSVSGDRRTVIL